MARSVEWSTTVLSTVCLSARLPLYLPPPSPSIFPLSLTPISSSVVAGRANGHSHCLAVFPSFLHHRSFFLSLSQNALLCFSPLSFAHSPTHSLSPPTLLLTPLSRMVMNMMVKWGTETREKGDYLARKKSRGRYRLAQFCPHHALTLSFSVYGC